MACHTSQDLSSNLGRNDLYDTLWELHRCDGSGVICRWKLVDQNFLNHFVAQFEKVKTRIALSNEEVLEAIFFIKKATADTRRKSHETQSSLPALGNLTPRMWGMENSHD